MFLAAKKADTWVLHTFRHWLLGKESCPYCHEALDEPARKAGYAGGMRQIIWHFALKEYLSRSAK